MLEKAQPLQTLKKTHPGKNQALEALLDTDNKLKWLPLHSSAKNMIVLIHAESAEVIKIVDINPYPN